jgi:hypothetical protein
MKATHLIEIVQALNEGQVRYLIVGGLAVNAHGYLRYTNDVDVVLQLEPGNILRGLNALSRLGYRPKQPVDAAQFADVSRRESWIRDKAMLVFPLWCEQRIETPIDIFVREPFDFETEWKVAVRSEVSEGIIALFVSFSTLCVMKQQAGRPQDLADISQLRMIQGNGASRE